MSYNCCGKIFVTIKLFTKHCLKHSNNDEKSVCFCGKLFNNYNQFQKQRNKKHSNKENISVPIIRNRENESFDQSFESIDDSINNSVIKFS